MMLWKKTGDKPKQLELQDDFPVYFDPAVKAFNFLKKLRHENENGIMPISLSDVEVYLTRTLSYSDPEYIRWMTEVIVACDEAERKVVKDKIMEARKSVAPKKSPKRGAK